LGSWNFIQSINMETMMWSSSLSIYAHKDSYKFILYFSKFYTNLCELWKFERILWNYLMKLKMEKGLPGPSGRFRPKTTTFVDRRPAAWGTPQPPCGLRRWPSPTTELPHASPHSAARLRVVTMHSGLAVVHAPVAHQWPPVVEVRG
jgi:hypothetical protein